jgi:hypothetical protein
MIRIIKSIDWKLVLFLIIAATPSVLGIWKLFELITLIPW